VHGADKNKYNAQRETALDIATRMGVHDMIHVLQAGVEADKRMINHNKNLIKETALALGADCDELKDNAVYDKLLNFGLH
jgi:hypothetical protein